MTFGKALEALKRGAHIKREGWNGKDQYLVLVKDLSFTIDGRVINATHDTMGKRAIAFVGTQGVQVGWLASQADMLSEDWIIIE